MTLDPAGIVPDIIVATGHLAGRAGAAALEFGHTGDDTTPPGEVTWWAHVTYQGARITTDGHPDPTAAFFALAVRILSGATCKCGRLVTLTDDVTDACRWQLTGPRWVPGCTVPPIRVTGKRGDMAAIRRATPGRPGAAR